VSPSAPPLPAPGIGIPNFQKVITALVAAATALVVLGNATAKADPSDPYRPGPGPVLPLPCGNGFNCGPMGRPNLPPPPPGGWAHGCNGNSIAMNPDNPCARNGIGCGAC
jgi:hypothetical protein